MKSASTILFCCVAGLLALGMVILFSASTGRPEAAYLVMQPIWCAVGLIVCGLAASGDYGWLRKFSWLLLLIALVLLALVFVPPWGTHINGASRWLAYAGFRLQPSELAKLALILCLARYIEYYQRQMPTFWRGLILPGFIIAPVLALIFKEPDVGTTVLLATVSVGMLFIGGARLRYLIPLAVSGAVALGFFLVHNPVRMRRILAFLYPDENKEGVGYQAYQAMVALGAGGTTGIGLGDGRQKLGFVPEHHTDFIFSVIGEELGLIATLTVIVAFLAIVICGIYIAWHSRDAFGMMLGSGITMLIGLQVVINIGVVTGSLPNKGISLPFISYGGSNLVIMLGCVGLLLNIARHAGESCILPRQFSDAVGPGARS